MRQNGSSQKDIAQVFRITQASIFKILKHHRETGLMIPRPRYGCPKKITARHDRYLLRLWRNSRLDPFHQITCVNSAGEVSTFERWLFGKATCEEAPTAKKTPTSAICVRALAQWRIQVFAVSSRWSCSKAQTSSRGSTRWVCTA